MRVHGSKIELRCCVSLFSKRSQCPQRSRVVAASVCSDTILKRSGADNLAANCQHQPDQQSNENFAHFSDPARFNHRWPLLRRIKELALSVLPPSYHAPLPMMINSI